MDKLEAIDHFVIVEKKVVKETAAGIIIPDASDIDDTGKLVRGAVISIGEKVSERVKVGGWVLYPFYAGNAWEYEGKVYVTIKDDKILAVEKA